MPSPFPPSSCPLPRAPMSSPSSPSFEGLSEQEDHCGGIDALLLAAAESATPLSPITSTSTRARTRASTRARTRTRTSSESLPGSSASVSSPSAATRRPRRDDTDPPPPPLPLPRPPQLQLQQQVMAAAPAPAPPRPSRPWRAFPADSCLLFVCPLIPTAPPAGIRTSSTPTQPFPSTRTLSQQPPPPVAEFYADHFFAHCLRCGAFFPPGQLHLAVDRLQTHLCYRYHPLYNARPAAGLAQKLGFRRRRLEEDDSPETEEAGLSTQSATPVQPQQQAQSPPPHRGGSFVDTSQLRFSAGILSYDDFVRIRDRNPVAWLRDSAPDSDASAANHDAAALAERQWTEAQKFRHYAIDSKHPATERYVSSQSQLPSRPACHHPCFLPFMTHFPLSVSASLSPSLTQSSAAPGFAQPA